MDSIQTRNTSKRLFAALVLVGAQSLLAAQAQAVTVDFQIKSSWATGYSTDVVLKNDTGTAINGWTVSFKLGTGFQSLSRATSTGSDPYTFTNLSYSAAIANGATQKFAFTGTAAFDASKLANCVFNGRACTFLVNGVPVSASSSSRSSAAASSVAASSRSSAAASSVAASSRSSAAASSVAASSRSSAAASSVAASSRSSSAASSATGTVRYQQNFDVLPATTIGSYSAATMWNHNIDSAKVAAHPENAQVAKSCGPDGSNCFRVVYRQADGVHVAPPSSPVFTTSGGVIGWTLADTNHTNTATDVTQRNIFISGKINDAGARYGDTPIPGKAYTLSYDVYFESGFDFAKGGKLPGLASSNFDSGCTEDGNVKRSGSNWSERLMWRPNGRLELYSYDQSRPSGSCGIDRMIDEVAGDAKYEVPGTIPSDGKFRLKAGVWYTIRLSVKMNDNNRNTYQTDSSGRLVLDSFGDPIVTGGNGAVSLAIKRIDNSEKRLLLFPNVALRDECNGPCSGSVPDTAATQINALFFSTFYGGNETKRLTCIDPRSTATNVIQAPMPSYSGLTLARFTELCAGQVGSPIYPTLTWVPKTPSAARFDNMKVVEGYTEAPF